MSRKQEQGWKGKEKWVGAQWDADTRRKSDHVAHQRKESWLVWVLMAFHFWLLIPDKFVFAVASVLFKVSYVSVPPHTRTRTQYLSGGGTSVSSSFDVPVICPPTPTTNLSLPQVGTRAASLPLHACLSSLCWTASSQRYAWSRGNPSTLPDPEFCLHIPK